MDISITLLLILFTSLISYQGFTRHSIIDRLKHNPVRETQGGEWYRMLTSGFVHADWIHLLVNMYVLYSFGEYIESFIIAEFDATQGRIIYLLMYVLNIILANIPTTIRHREHPGFSSIGASGAVSGIVFMFILLQPWATLTLFFIIPVPAVVLGIGYLAYSSWAAKQGHGRLDHAAHFAGAVWGMAMLILLKHDVAADFIRKLIHDFPL